MVRKLNTEHIDAVYKAASDNRLESVLIYKNRQGRNRGNYMVDYKTSNDILPGYIDSALHDVFKSQLLELKSAVIAGTLTDVDISYVVIAKRMKVKIRTKE